MKKDYSTKEYWFIFIFIIAFISGVSFFMKPQIKEIFRSNQTNITKQK